MRAQAPDAQPVAAVVVDLGQVVRHVRPAARVEALVLQFQVRRRGVFEVEPRARRQEVVHPVLAVVVGQRVAPGDEPAQGHRYARQRAVDLVVGLAPQGVGQPISVKRPYAAFHSFHTTSTAKLALLLAGLK